MILFLSTSISLGAQTAKADTCKTESTKQCTKVKEENETVLATTKQVSKKDKKSEKKTKRIEEGFLFKRQSISQL